MFVKRWFPKAFSQRSSKTGPSSNLEEAQDAHMGDLPKKNDHAGIV